MSHIFGRKANGEILKSKRKKKTLLHQAAYRWREGKDRKCPSHRSLDEIRGTVGVRVAIRAVLQMNWVLLNPKAAVRHSIFALRIVLWPVRESRRSPPPQQPLVSYNSCQTTVNMPCHIVCPPSQLGVCHCFSPLARVNELDSGGLGLEAQKVLNF